MEGKSVVRNSTREIAAIRRGRHFRLSISIMLMGPAQTRSSERGTPLKGRNRLILPERYQISVKTRRAGIPWRAALTGRMFTRVLCKKS